MNEIYIKIMMFVMMFNKTVIVNNWESYNFVVHITTEYALKYRVLSSDFFEDGACIDDLDTKIKHNTPCL
jgi:hypothetical protein